MIEKELTPEQLKRLIMTVSFPNAELYDSLEFCISKKKLLAYVDCSDFFVWGSADSEPITSDEDIDLLEKSIADCRTEDFGDMDGAKLYCARRRRMRPQGACYKYLDEKNYKLFDACGPAREISFANPQNQEGEYKFTKEKNEPKFESVVTKTLNKINSIFKINS